jgi:Flp pilus assembly protein TadG
MTACVTKNLRPDSRPTRRGFASNEDGSMLVFGMSLLLVMLMLGGMAVDLMRYEQRRTLLQQTTDRAVLAAASLTQTRTPTSVVNDYFAKADLNDFLRSVTVTQGANYRTVQADAEAELQPFFLQMMGIDELSVPSASTAEQRISRVEIVMVLDVSGSMNTVTSNGLPRIENLKTAANSFVNKVKNGDTHNLVSISLVPFNGQINLGETLRSKFNATSEHGVANVNCIDLPPAAFDNVTLSRTLPMAMTAHTDNWSGTTWSTSFVNIQGHSLNASGAAVNNWCPPSTGNVVSLYNDSEATLTTKINALSAIGATSINAGMRWGLAFLDPAQRPLISELIASNDIPASSAGRPYDWEDEEAMKVIVLMTDGENFPEARVVEAYKSNVADSPVYFNSTDNSFAIRHTAGRPTAAGTDEYWYPAGNAGAGQWQATATAGYTQQSWSQVWPRARMSWVIWQLYARALGTTDQTRSDTYYAWLANFRTLNGSVGNTPAMNTQLQDMCNLAKAQDVVIYGIAVDAPTGGKTQIAACASSPAYYFDTTGGNLVGTFNAVASNLSQLRLTQ